ncbi:MAG: hypothetical protein HP491_16290 [Nitrospira sp.]|nr:hypothetical protein [Nitrospira sp.]MBH0182700.1 hypothetical protein [Nitrospira sp.]MBH0184812.1 hypothetical protein [Nitrospira sp.]
MRMPLLLGISVCSASLFLTVPTFAGPGINVEYSADQTIETADGATKITIYSTPTMERQEFVDGGQKMINITRFDKKVIWNVMPEEKMYIEMATGSPKDKKEKPDLADFKIEQTPMGQETVNGIALNKGKMIMTGNDGSKMGGFMWTTKEGIVTKLDAISVEKGKKDRFKLELTNLKIGKQPVSLFEVPKDYEKVDMGGMMGMGDVMKGMMGQ